MHVGSAQEQITLLQYYNKEINLVLHSVRLDIANLTVKLLHELRLIYVMVQ